MMQEPSLTNQGSDSTPEQTPPPRRHGGGGIVFPLILIFAGVVLLLNTTGALPWSVWGRLWVLWPVFLILTGLDILLARAPFPLRVLLGLAVAALVIGAGAYLILNRPAASEGGQDVQASWPREGVEQGNITVNAGIADLTIDALEDSKDLAQVDLRGNSYQVEPSFHTAGGTAYLKIVHPNINIPWTGSWNAPAQWHINLSPQVALTLEIDPGVGKSQLDLGSLQVEELQLNPGVGRVVVVLPGKVERGTVRIKGGVGGISIVIPEGVAARIQVNKGLGGVSIDTGRFRQSGDTYTSADYDTAQYRLDVNIDGGVGGIDIR